MNNIDMKKLLLYFALLFIGLSLWGQWMNNKNKTESPAAAQSQPSTSVSSMATSDVPRVDKIVAHKTTATVKAKAPDVDIVPVSRLITVDTDTLKVKIDKQGGRIVGVALKDYPVSLDKKDTPTRLISLKSDTFFVAESGLAEQPGGSWSDAKTQYKSPKNHYKGTGDAPLVVNLTGQSRDGLFIEKQWVFNPKRYVFNLNYKLHNQSASDWKGRFYAQIRHKKTAKSSGFMRFNTYTGASYFSPDKPYTKLSYKKMSKTNLNQVIKGGWVAVQKHYFLTAWIPGQTNQHHYFSHVDAGDIYTVGFLGPLIDLPAGKTYEMSNQFYAGPELVDNLEPLAKGLKLTVDYGWLWPISMLIMWGMRHIYQLIGNWGWSIILITLAIKLLFLKFSESSYRSMAKLRELQPRLERLKAVHGEDKQALSRATIELYKQEKVNPMGGCLPFLVQIPVFIALYYVLIEAVELRQAPFVLWIHDLSIKDPYFILPVLMGVSMLLQQQMNPTSSDPIQAKVMYLLPVIFTVLFLNFPAGLVLYWLVNNCLSILQQWYINWRISRPAQ